MFCLTNLRLFHCFQYEWTLLQPFTIALSFLSRLIFIVWTSTIFYTSTYHLSIFRSPGFWRGYVYKDSFASPCLNFLVLISSLKPFDFIQGWSSWFWKFIKHMFRHTIEIWLESYISCFLHIYHKKENNTRKCNKVSCCWKLLFIGRIVFLKLCKKPQLFPGNISITSQHFLKSRLLTNICARSTFNDK